MNIETLGNLGDFIGGLAVIVSVLYLAIQIRQNSRLLKATALSAVTDSYLSFNILLGGDPKASRVFQVGLEDFSSLSEEEQRQFLNLLRLAFASYQHVHQQYERGLLDDQTWEQFRNFATSLLVLPHIGAWWKERKAVFTPKFVEALDTAPMAKRPPLANTVLNSMLKAAESREDA
jgi:hypothetical protein